jgi:hypothetical protein
MRKTMVTVAILGLVWIGYLVWPVYDLFVLIRAIETHDVDTVTRHVYFDAVRISLIGQVVDAYMRRTGMQIGPLRRNIAAAAIANPVVEKLISREALSQLLTVCGDLNLVLVEPGQAVPAFKCSACGLWHHRWPVAIRMT